jgi:quercetin dioxygenase-like cupin family protein
MTKKKMKSSSREKVTASKVIQQTEKITRASRRAALTRTVLKGKPRRAESQHVVWNSIEAEELNPLLFRSFVVGQNVMVAHILLKKGCVVPMHSHPNEQISCILEGALEFAIDGKVIVARGGEVLAIPPNMPHAAVALSDTVALDVFNPPRADWINKTDSYLR